MATTVRTWEQPTRVKVSIAVAAALNVVLAIALDIPVAGRLCFLLFAAFFVAVGLLLVHHVELRSDDTLFLRSSVRERVVPLEAIKKISWNDGVRASFHVRFKGGRFSMEEDDSSRQLVDAVLRLRPHIPWDRYTGEDNG